MKARLLSLILALCLAFSLPVSAAEENGRLIPKARDYAAFTDTKGTLAETAARLCCEAGLMDGIRAGKFSPKSPLTNAQVIVIAARLHKLLTGGTLEDFVPVSKTGDVWYTPYAAYLGAEIPILADTMSQMCEFVSSSKEPCTRFFFADLLSQVLLSADISLPAINQISQLPDVDPKQTQLRERLLALYNAGVLTGSDAYGSFRGFTHLTRGQAAVMLARIIDPSLRRGFTLQSFDLWADLLGLSKDAAVAYVDGEPVSAAEFSYVLFHNFFSGVHLDQPSYADDTVTEAVLYALQWYKNYAAEEKLAENLNLSLSEETLAEIKTESARYAGYAGFSQEIWQLELERRAMRQALLNHFNALYGEDSSLMFHDFYGGDHYMNKELNALKAAITVTAADSLKNLDWAAIEKAAESTPYAEYFSDTIV